MSDDHVEDGLLNGYNLEHRCLDLLVCLAHSIRIVQHVFRENFVVLCDQRLQRVLDKHLI